MADFSMHDDSIDTRDIITRIEEIKLIKYEDPEDSGIEEIELANEVLDAELTVELEMLEEIIDDVGSEATSGVTLINESNFEDYAREYATDLGLISDDERWPATCIDWEEAANELKDDFSSLVFDTETFYYR